MIVNCILLAAGIIIGKFKRTYLLYLCLILYTFSAADITLTGISVYSAMNWLSVVPIFIYLIVDGVLCHGFSKKNIPKGVFISLAVLFAYILFRYLSSAHPDRFNLLVTLGTCFTMFIAGLFYFDQIRFNHIINIAGVLILFEVVLVIGQSIFGSSFTRLLFIFDFTGANIEGTVVESLYRATGTFSDPNYFALFMCVLSSTMLIKFSPINKAIFLAGILGTILSFSRMGMLIGALLLLVFLVKSLKIQTRLNMFYLGISMMVILLFLFIILNTGSGINSFAADVFDNVKYRLSDVYDFGQGGRVYIIQSYFNNILNINNFVLGLGFENFEGELQKATGLLLVAHNEYLQVFADIGLIGIILIAVTAFAALKNSNFKGLTTRNAMFWTLVAIVAGNFFLMTTYNIYLYFFIALYIGCSHAYQKEPVSIKGGNANGEVYIPLPR